MFKKEIKLAVKDALLEFIQSDEFEQRIGGIVQAVVDAKLDYEMTMEKFDHRMGQSIVKEKKVNVLHVLAETIPHMVGAMRGAQEDANKTLNTFLAVKKAAIQHFNQRRIS